MLEIDSPPQMEDGMRTLIDLRVLQDSNYRFRGIGQHTRLVLEAVRTQSSHICAFVDDRLPPIGDDILAITDKIVYSLATTSEIDIFVSASPMTHDNTCIQPILKDKKSLKIAILYDLIPLMFPERYLRDPMHRSEYFENCLGLRSFDKLIAISEFTKSEAVRLLKIAHQTIAVSGCGIRSALIADYQTRPSIDRSHILFPGGGDVRKNAECALMAHAGSSEAQSRRVPLIVTGHYPDHMINSLRRTHLQAGGDPQLLSFMPHLSDEELSNIYAAAKVVAVPSRAEGFSLPIVEGASLGAVVVASNCAAHPELIKDQNLLFDPDSPARLTHILDRLLSDENALEQARRDQAWLKDRFSESAVKKRIQDIVETARLPRPATLPQASILRGNKPNIAFLTPVPAALSGVADYSLRTIEAMAKRCNVHVFSSNVDVRPIESAASMNSISAFQNLQGQYQHALHSIGNSHFHGPIFKYLMDYGGASIVHDSRMIDFYLYYLGEETAKAVFNRETGKQCDTRQLIGYHKNQSQLPCLFLSDIVSASLPCIVHTEALRNLVKMDYSVDVTCVPFALYGPVAADDVSKERVRGARSRLGIDSDEIIVSSFGIVDHEKAALEMIGALALLCKGYPRKIRLVFVGTASASMAHDIVARAAALGVEKCVTIHTSPLSKAEYADWLFASDAAIQLRRYGFGQASGAVSDCVGAALPLVLNKSLSVSMALSSEAFVLEDNLSEQEIADQVQNALGYTREQTAARTRFYRESRTMEKYAQKLLEVLGV